MQILTAVDDRLGRRLTWVREIRLDRGVPGTVGS